ncbi:recombinase RecT [Brevibacillus halotolerans]|uniref:recombinase RecT n=1 Tax=Brevibacillus halotolerans TaxID=1507437 RepID=UPI0015EFD2F4|nr:recombinase RecT [Brevibacillus halotolerans]MBA4535135.1 recombinase RecT [Brevibacillus halotolerans]
MTTDKKVDQSNISKQLAARTQTKGENFNMIIKKELADNFQAIKSIVPKHMTPERLARITLTAISRTSKLADCTPASIVGAVMNCATLGLEPNLMGHAYLVPFKDNETGKWECQFQIGYKGQIDLIRRTGDVSKIYAETVYENDLFIYLKGEDKRLVHVPFDMLHLLENFQPNKDDFLEIMMDQAITRIKERNPKDEGKAVRYYSAYRLKDGAFDFFTLTAEQCLQHATKHSKSKKNDKLVGPWVNHFDAMAKKTCIKEMAKYMPISIEVQEKLALDEAVLKPRRDNGIESENIFDADYKVIEVEEETKPDTQEESA